MKPHPGGADRTAEIQPVVIAKAQGFFEALLCVLLLTDKAGKAVKLLLEEPAAALACSGQPDASLCTYEKGKSQIVLQLRYMLAYSLLGDK